MPKLSNNIRLVDPRTGEPGHFTLREFANKEGLAVVHPSVLVSLEAVREQLCKYEDGEVYVIITDATRTQEDLERLADELGWTDQGGLVSRNSKHLVKHGGIAVDIKAQRAKDRRPVDQQILGNVCRRHFDWVKSDYADGHVHADNRERAV